VVERLMCFFAKTAEDEGIVSVLNRDSFGVCARLDVGHGMNECRRWSRVSMKSTFTTIMEELLTQQLLQMFVPHSLYFVLRLVLYTVSMILTSCGTKSHSKLAFYSQ
jgi:hypothetical protein